MTLQHFSETFETVPASVAWYLSFLGEAKGRQELFTRQSPQRLRVLREHALIESAISSNRMEGVNVEASRIGTILFGKPVFRDRDEEEVHGYREALSLIHEHHKELPVTEETILRLHRLARGEVWDSGRYKERDSDIIEKLPDGNTRVRFATVPAVETPSRMKQLVNLYDTLQRDARIPPLVFSAAFNLDFLCIHPFRDGSGRVSRLLLLLQAYHAGYEVGRYISLERLIEQNKERYYETLEQSSQGWHQGNHNPWHYLQFILYIFKLAYQEFEDRLGRVASPKGEKTNLVLDAINNVGGEFSVAELQRKCPGVSVDLIRRILKQLQADHKVKCQGRGQKAKWRKMN